jgi:hypothetical protein
MDESFAASSPAERYEHNGYTITVEARSGERGQWYAVLNATRGDMPVALDAPPDVGPYWATREEALRAGVERARHLLDLRDGRPLDQRNPARGDTL